MAECSAQNWGVQGWLQAEDTHAAAGREGRDAKQVCTGGNMHVFAPQT